MASRSSYCSMPNALFRLSRSCDGRSGNKYLDLTRRFTVEGNPMRIDVLSANPSMSGLSLEAFENTALKELIYCRNLFELSSTESTGKPISYVHLESFATTMNLILVLSTHIKTKPSGSSGLFLIGLPLITEISSGSFPGLFVRIRTTPSKSTFSL